MIKQLATIGALAVIIGGGSYLAGQHYNDYQDRHNKATASQQQQAITSAVNKQKASDEKQINDLRAENTTLQAECMKGLNAYVKLSTYAPAAIKTATPSPVCGDGLL